MGESEPVQAVYLCDSCHEEIDPRVTPFLCEACAAREFAAVFGDCSECGNTLDDCICD